MRRRTLLTIGLLVALLPFSTAVPARGQSSNAPYIYYYSDEINAFIIERADGTDTRILGAGLMPPLGGDLAYVSGPGWSPSGKWFAWQLSQIGAYGADDGDTAYAVKADGSRHLTLLDGMQNVQMAWAPYSDRLFVVSQYFQPSPNLPPHDLSNGYLHTDFYLIDLTDPNIDRILVSDKQSVYAKNGNPYTLAPMITWIDDANVIVEYASEPHSQDTGLTTHFRIFNTAGNVTDKTIDFGLASGANDYLVVVSALGSVVYNSGEMLEIENLITGNRQSLGELADHSPTIELSPDGHYALVAGNNLLLLSLETGKVQTILSPLIRFDTDASRPRWSPDSRHVLFMSNGKLYHFSLANDLLKELPLSIDTNDNNVSWLWKEQGQAVFTQPDVAGQSALLYRYDFNTGTSVSAKIPTSGDGGPFQADIRSDGRYAAFMMLGTVIYNTQNQTKLELRPAARSWSTGSGGEVSWNNDYQWLLTYQNGLVASGGDCCRHVGIVRSDGIFQRDLTRVSIPVTSTAVDWLPSQVDLTNLVEPLTNPLFPRPTKTLMGVAWTFNLSWSPDEKELLSGGGGFEDSKVREWENATGKSKLIFEKIGEDQQVVWQENATGTYTPQLAPITHLDWKNVGIFATSRDGQRVFAIDGTTNLGGVYDTATHKLIHQVGGSNNFTSASFRPDGRLLAVGSPDSPSQIWDTQTWQVVATLRYPAPAVAFSPDGKWLAASRSWDIDIWSVADLLAWGKPVF